MEPWEDELLRDDDFSEEEEDTEEQIEEADVEMDEDGFADWVDASDGAPEDERLEEVLAEERTLELESELEQDEHPRDYAAELEDEEEEAAPISEKRLKREIRAEALRRLEEAARTESDFLTVVDEWNKLDRNRERRERDHENLRGDVPLEFQAVPDPKIAPLWMNAPDYRQLCSGFFLDILFDCPYEMHELTADKFISDMIRDLSEEHKEVLFYLSLRLYSATRLAAPPVRGKFGAGTDATTPAPTAPRLRVPAPGRWVCSWQARPTILANITISRRSATRCGPLSRRTSCGPTA